MIFFSDGYTEPLYKVEITETPIFSLKIIRKSTNQAIFDTNLPGLIFSEQFVQLPVRRDYVPPSSILSILRSGCPLQICMELGKTSSMDFDTTFPPGRCVPSSSSTHRFGRCTRGTNHLQGSQSIGLTCMECIPGKEQSTAGVANPPGTLWWKTMVAPTRSSSSTQTPRSLRLFLCQASYTEP